MSLDSERALVLFSGGQDSTVCLVWALDRFSAVETVGFDYGQRHSVELDCRTKVRERLRDEHPGWGNALGEDHIIDLRFLKSLGETAMTDEVEIEIEETTLPVDENAPTHGTIAATYDAASGKVALYQEPLNNWVVDPSRVASEQTTTMTAIGQNDVPFLMAGYWVWREAERSKVGGFFNGKIDSPRLFGRALGREEIEELRKGGAPGSPVV